MAGKKRNETVDEWAERVRLQDVVDDHFLQMYRADPRHRERYRELLMERHIRALDQHTAQAREHPQAPTDIRAETSIENPTAELIKFLSALPPDCDIAVFADEVDDEMKEHCVHMVGGRFVLPELNHDLRAVRIIDFINRYNHDGDINRAKTVSRIENQAIIKFFRYYAPDGIQDFRAAALNKARNKIRDEQRDDS